MTHAQSHTTDQFDETLAAGNHGVANAAVDLKLYDTATHAVSRFEPIKPGEVGMYVCGATVQSAPHIGHIRAAVAFDIIRRWFERLGYKVTFIRNVTDIDDKILDKAAAAGEDWWARAYHYEREFTHAYNELGVLAPTYEPRATGHIIDMVHLIERIIDNGHAYVIRDEHGELTGDVYFDVASWPHYGELTHQKQTAEVDEAAAVADRMGPSVDASGDDKYNPADPADLSENKRDPRDFALWKRPKSTDPADARWKTPFGTGRPGWHIECSAMSYRYLDGMFDIHGGGLDLRFPHHENEMAQTRAAGYRTANRWMHSAWVTAKGEKMSKSLGNGLSVPVVLAEHSAWVVRYALGSVQYRSMLEWSDQTLAEAEAAYERIMNFIGHAADALGEQLNNSVYGMVRQWQTLFYNNHYSATILHEEEKTGLEGVPDFVKLADAYGCVALRARTKDEAVEAIRRANEINDRPVLVDFRGWKDAMVWPMGAAGDSNGNVTYLPGIKPLHQADGLAAMPVDSDAQADEATAIITEEQD